MWSKSTPTLADENDGTPILTNQTQFGMEKPLFEERAIIIDPAAAKVAAESGNLPKKQKMPFPLFLGGVAVILMVMGILILSLFKTTQQMIQQAAVVSSPTTQQVQDPYVARLNELQQDFNQADPSQTTIPFPPVSLNISL